MPIFRPMSVQLASYGRGFTSMNLGMFCWVKKGVCILYKRAQHQMLFKGVKKLSALVDWWPVKDVPT
jgi:hypothetical protein